MTTLRRTLKAIGIPPVKDKKDNVPQKAGVTTPEFDLAQFGSVQFHTTFGLGKRSHMLEYL